jgi:DNA replication protein DnaC
MSIIRSTALNNLPQRKVEGKILSLVQGCETCSKKNITRIEQAYDGLCERCSIMLIAYNRYAEANIPIEFWDLEMSSFTGSKELKKTYDQVVGNLPKMYDSGMSICLAGSHGIGKSFVLTSILKIACQKNYSCLYTTLSDMINVLINSPSYDKYFSQRELAMVDWLVVDEFDSRYVSDGGADLFGRTAEHLFRTRTQNKIPTLFASNSPNPINAFTGSIKTSIESLFNRVKIIPILSEDFRKTQKQ